MLKQNRAVFLFDGPNFYRNLRSVGIERGNLDFKKFAAYFAGQCRTVTDIVYFTSPTDQRTDTANYAKQQRFFAALQNAGITLRLGKLMQQHQICQHCGNTQVIKKEKSLDVQLALAIALGAANNEWDTAYIITCDSDLIPAIEHARNLGKKVFLLLPSGAKCYHVGNACNATLPITQEIINKCQVG